MPDTTRLRLLGNLCAAYTSVDPQKKFYYANVYKALAEKLHDGKAVADAYVNMGISYGIRSMPDSALYNFRLAYNQAEKINYLQAMGRSLSNIGFLYDRIENYSESIKYYFQALTIFKKLKYEKGINQCNTNIGSIYYDLRQYKVAESYFLQCYNSYKASNDEAGTAYAMFTLGNCYTELHQYSRAATFFKKSLAIRQKIGDNNGVALVLKGIGNLYNHQEKYDQALAILQKGYSMTVQMDDKYEQCALLSDIAEAYLGKKDFDAAKQYSLKALALARKIRTDLIIIGSLKRLVTIYREKNDIKKAFDYQTQYVAAQDSLMAEKALKEITLTEFGRIRTENANLTRNNKRIVSENMSNLERINHYSNIIVLISVGFISVILLLLIQYRRNLEKQAANRLLQQQKREIATINKELAALNEEVTTQMELTNAQNAELEKLNEVKNKFFSIISHDLRGPLSTLQALFGIYREGDVGEKELAGLLSRLEDTIISTGAFLDNLLEWSKSQLEGVVINAVDFNISKYIEENIHLWDARINLKKLKIFNTADPVVMTYADPNMINLVIRNLLSNSVKFCNPGDEISISAGIKDDKVRLEVSDTGPGISEEDQEKLFSLQHIVSSGTQGEKGNHLGLILCREMIMQNNGSLLFESHPGQGTTFIVELPTAKNLPVNN